MMKNVLLNPPENAASTRGARVGARRSSSRASTRRRGFTLLEVLVTLALMAIMLAIVFVPLNSAFNIFQIGNSRNDLQLATRQTTSQLESDLRKAVYVFPNSVLLGVTDKAPFNGAPYFATNACTGARVSNTGRLDMLMPLHDDEIFPVPMPAPNGSVVSPLRPAYYVVTYYARLDKPSNPYDALSNPLYLFRAKMPYKNSDGTPFTNIDVSSGRYGTGTCSSSTSNSNSLWLTQDTDRRVNLEPFSANVDAAKPNVPAMPAITGSHTLASPRDLSLPPMNEDGSDLRPRSTSFICEDTNGDGKIDRVTINLTLVKYDTASVGGSASGKPTYQQNAATDVVNLVNVR